MARTFKFGMGDMVRLKDGSHLITPDGEEYQEHLTVIYYFWDGAACCYVLSTGDDDICLVCDEQSLELEERAPMPMPEEEAKPESYFLGSVFLINRRLVAAEGLEKAIELFHSHPSHRNETIQSITLQDPDPALIQNGKEE